MNNNNNNPPAKTNKSPYIRVYFATQAEKDLVQQAARECGLSDSAFCRLSLDNEVSFIESEKE